MWTKIVRVLLFVCLIPAFAATQAAYTVTDLGSLSPTAINTLAQVVGNYNNQAYIWAFGRVRSLGTLSGGTISTAAAINDHGVVTGTADGAGTIVSTVSGFPNAQCSDLTQPFIWTEENGMQGLGTISVGGEFIDVLELYCFLPFEASGINARGQVVGNTFGFGSSYQWGFLWTSADGMTSFGGSYEPTFVNGISNKGQIVGQNSEGPDTSYSTSWKNGVATDLGALGGSVDSVSSSSLANGVNERGQIVGWSTVNAISLGACYEFFDPSNCIIHAVLWTPSGVISDLGTLPGDQSSSALKVNLFGQVIGSSGNTVTFQQPSPQVIGRPFVWSQANGMQDLNTLIPPNSGWVLNLATDINAWGQIVGSGTFNGQPHGFLLTPRNPFQLN